MIKGDNKNKHLVFIDLIQLGVVEETLYFKIFFSDMPLSY